MNVHRVASRVGFWCGVVALIGCSTKSDGRIDSANGAAATANAPVAGAATVATPAGAGAAPIRLSEVAGKWTIRSVPQGVSDTTPIVSTLTATASTAGWKTTYADGQVVPLKVTVAGDSIVTDGGTHQSLRRKGVMVTTRGVYRKDGDKLVGTVTAHYVTKGADSVLVLRAEGTKSP